MNWKTLLTLILSGFFTCADGLVAEVINVPDDFETIQAGIDAAEQGDTVLVLPGRFRERVQITDKELTLGSLFIMTGDTAYIDSTIIDQQNRGQSAISVRSCNSENGTHLSGFSIFGARTDYGGGIYVNDSRFCIDHCHVTDGQATGGGGLYYTNGSEGEVHHVTFLNNRANLGGGGCAIVDSSDVELSSCTFTDNIACYGAGTFINDGSNVSFDNCYFRNSEYTYCGGGGISSRRNGEIVITNSIITGCTADIGGGLHIEHSQLLIMRNVEVCGNSADTYAGGIYINGGEALLDHCLISDNHCNEIASGIGAECRLDINFCTIVNNTSDDVATAICNSYESETTIRNSIIWGHGRQSIICRGIVALVINNTDIENGEDAVGVDDEGGQLIWGEGNIDVNPQFANSEDGNFNLTAGSPCIDAGMEIFIEADGTSPDMGRNYFHQRDIDLPSDFLDFGELELNVLDSAIVEIVNIGGNNLILDEISLSPINGVFFFGRNHNHIEMQPHTTFHLKIYCLAIDSGDYNANLNIYSNDPDEPEIEFPLAVSIIPGQSVSSNTTELPTEFSLSAPYPNPFNSTTTIGYSLTAAGNVSLAVYDLSGREVTRLVDSEQTAGNHEVVWTADGVASGVYMVKLDAGGVVAREKVVLVK